MNEVMSGYANAQMEKACVEVSRMDRTIRENIDARIEGMRREIAALEETKLQMEKTGLLDVKASTLANALRF